MKSKLSPKEKELYRRIDEVLHYLWDPIRVSDTPQARDEYHSYLPQVFSLVLNGVDKATISEHLALVESDRMGMSPNRETIKHVVEILIETKRWIIDEFS